MLLFAFVILVVFVACCIIVSFKKGNILPLLPIALNCNALHVHAR